MIGCFLLKSDESIKNKIHQVFAVSYFVFSIKYMINIGMLEY